MQLIYPLPELVEGDFSIRTITIVITGFHFITPRADTGRPVGTLGWCTNHLIRSKGQSPAL